MGVVKHSDAKKYIASKGGSLVEVKGNYNVRKGTKSANVGKHKNERWGFKQFARAWSMVGIDDPKWK